MAEPAYARGVRRAWAGASGKRQDALVRRRTGRNRARRPRRRLRRRLREGGAAYVRRMRPASFRQGRVRGTRDRRSPGIASKSTPGATVLGTVFRSSGGTDGRRSVRRRRRTLQTAPVRTTLRARPAVPSAAGRPGSSGQPWRQDRRRLHGSGTVEGGPRGHSAVGPPRGTGAARAHGAAGRPRAEDRPGVLGPGPGLGTRLGPGSGPGRCGKPEAAAKGGAQTEPEAEPEAGPAPVADPRPFTFTALAS